MNSTTFPKAVIFDLDGVLVDSSFFHQQALERLGQELGVEITLEFHKATFGMRTWETLLRLFPTPPDDATMTELVERKEALFREVARGNLVPLPGATRLARAVKSAGYRVAIGSSTVHANVALVLEELGIRDCFDALIAGEDVSVGKPAPDVFLKAAEKLDVSPSRCVVIEDAIPGVEAAHRAGMRVVAVTTSQPRERLADADRVVDSLEELSPAEFASLLRWTFPIYAA